jgi:hypothetical protein
MACRPFLIKLTFRQAGRVVIEATVTIPGAP